MFWTILIISWVLVGMLSTYLFLKFAYKISEDSDIKPEPFIWNDYLAIFIVGTLFGYIMLIFYLDQKYTIEKVLEEENAN